MNRVRMSVVASVLILGGLGLEAANAQDQKKSTAASAPVDKRSNFRKFMDAIKGKETSYPKNRDWTTGRDDAISKPWLRR